MHIRNAILDDLDAITQVEAECFPQEEAATKDDFKARLSIYPDYFWLLYDDNTLVGFINGLSTNEKDLNDEMYKNTYLHNNDGKWQMIFGLNTIPQYRKQGCAEELIKHLITDSIKRNKEGVVLTCKENLVPYYSKFGFVNEGVSQSVHGNVVWYQMRLKF